MATLLLLLPVSGLAGFGLFGWWLHDQSLCEDDDLAAAALENYQGDYETTGEL